MKIGSVIKSANSYFLQTKRGQWRRILPSGLLQGNYSEDEIPGELVGVVEGSGDTEDVRALYEQLTTPSVAFPIGFSWESIHGIHEVKAHYGTPGDPQFRYGVLDPGRSQNGKNLTLDLFSESALKSEIERDTRQLPEQRERQKRAEEEYRILATEKADAEAKKRHLRRNLDSYLAQFPPLRRAKIEAALVHYTTWNSRKDGGSRFQLIESLIDEGYKVETVRGERRLTDSDGFYREGALTKTGLDYAEWLQDR